MDTLRVDICYRPIRVGWAVRKNDFAGLREAITLSHTMWGGRYNPLLVADEPIQAKQIAELFRVDLVTPIGDSAEAKQFAEQFAHLPSPFITDTLFVGSAGEQKRAHLLDIHNAAVALQEQGQLDAVKKAGFRAYSWQANDPLADVFLIRLGAFPPAEQTGTDYSAMFRDLFGAQSFAIDPAVALPLELVQRPGCQLLSQHGLRRHYSIRGGWETPGFYVGSATNFDDLVAYWNLRAANIDVMFVDPAHIGRFAEQMSLLRETLADRMAFWPEHRRGIGYWARIENPHVACQAPVEERKTIHAPLTNDSWNGRNIRAPMMYMGEARALGTVGRSENRPRVSFQLSDKPFSGDNWFYTQHLIASVSVGDLYDDAFTFAPPYVPELNEALSRTMHHGRGLMRAEPGRLGVVIGAPDHDIGLGSFPVAELFERIFDLAGFSTKPSNGGLITRQLINRLGGLQGARAFKIPGVRRLLKTYGPQQSFTKKAALSLIAGKDPENPDAKFSDHEDLHIEQRPIGTKLKPQDVFGYLVSKGLFRMGAELTCPVCRLASWTSLDALQQQVTCDLCGQEYDATRQLVEETWGYRRSGILGLEKNTQGAVPVALVLQQLDVNSNHMTPKHYASSLDLTPKNGDGEPCEVDFVWMRSGRGTEKTVVVLSECKDRQREAIDADDIENLRRLADALPADRFSTFILLAKLVPFEPAEIALAKTLNTEYAERAIILTARELEPYLLYSRTYKEFDIDQYNLSFEGMAHTTARIYFSDAPPVR